VEIVVAMIFRPGIDPGPEQDLRMCAANVALSIQWNK